MRQGRIVSMTLHREDGVDVTVTGEGHWESVRTNRFGESETGYYTATVAWPAKVETVSSGATDNEILIEAVDALIEAWSVSQVATDVATSLTCIEVERLADVLRARNEHEAADLWIACHAEADEPDDLHYKAPVPS